MEQQTKHTPTWFFYKNEKLKVIEVFSEDEQEFKTNIPFRVAIVTRLTDAKLIAEAPTTAAERDSLKEDIENALTQLGKTQSDLRKATDDNWYLQKERENLTKERDKLKEEVERWEGIYDEKMLKISKLKEEKDQLNKIIDGYQISISQFNALRDINKSLVEALKGVLMTGYSGTNEGSKAIELLKKLNAL